MKTTKRTLTVLLAVLMIFGLLVPGALAAEDASITPLSGVSPPAQINQIFTDPALATAVAYAFENYSALAGVLPSPVDVYTVVTQADLDLVVYLGSSHRLVGHGIENLQGLQYLPNLVTLVLGGNEITDITPLAGLTNLTVLYLFDNQISDISPLENLTALVLLWLGQNEISDITPLTNLTGIDSLTLHDNQITDISPLVGFTLLDSISLSNNQISDFRPLNNLPLLVWVTATDQEITLPPIALADPLVVTNNVFLPDGSRVTPTPSPISGTYTTPNITWTGLPATVTEVSYTFNVASPAGDFSGTVIQPLTPALVTPTPIATIFPDPVLAAYIAQVLDALLPISVTVATPVEQVDLDLITGLNPQGAGVLNLEGMQYLSSLTWLYLADHPLTNLSPLAGLISLEYLRLDDSGISDIAPLSGLINLEDLILTGNQITNISPLAGLVNLELLNLSDNQISDIPSLAGLTSLESLHLDDNEISNITNLAGLTNLEMLFLNNNQISNFQALDNLTNLIWVGATGQQITLPSRIIANPLAVENAVFQPDGSRITPTPSSISNSGTYTTPNVTWTGLPNTVTEVSYMFSVTSPIGEFSGTVRQPLTPATVQPPNNGGGGSTPPPQPDPDPEYRFLDVNSDHWFYDAVMFVYEQGIMQGVNATAFSPDATLSRGMVATILWRLDGEPVSTTSHSFGDVAAGTWYANAVAWAFENGIVQGVSATRFAPSDPITREQFATMLHRYAEFAGVDISVSADASLDHFVDAYRTSDWAEDAKLWANYNDLITGRTTTTIVPGGTASRAEAATILMRFIQNF